MFEAFKVEMVLFSDEVPERAIPLTSDRLCPSSVTHWFASRRQWSRPTVGALPSILIPSRRRRNKRLAAAETFERIQSTWSSFRPKGSHPRPIRPPISCWLATPALHLRDTRFNVAPVSIASGRDQFPPLLPTWISNWKPSRRNAVQWRELRADLNTFYSQFTFDEKVHETVIFGLLRLGWIPILGRFLVR